MPSPAFSKQYREWLARHFQRVYCQGSESLSQAITAQRPDLVAPALKELAICLHTRGAVSLLDGNQQGWHDIQAGYLAGLYAIRFAIPLKTGSCARTSPNDLVYAVVTLGLARLFAGDFDVHLLRDWIRPQYDVRQLTGKVASGGHILDCIMDDKCPCTPEQLRRDRRECCQKGDAWPKRPTLIPPFGVVDVEMAINFPDEAEFPYPAIEYRPTDDEFVVEGITAFHAWSDQR
jgi:hypothetical protein